MAPASAKTASSSPDLAVGGSRDGRRGGKSAEAFWTISEVARELELPQHVLRFWETKFPHIRPLKRGGGRRYYRPEELALLRRIRDL
ncbi:MAG: MerR family transcriptional regulator, partial [Rhodospirillales bacterium]